MTSKITAAAVLIGAAVALSACASAPVGSKLWCYHQQNKPVGDWTMNEALDFTQHCVIKYGFEEVKRTLNDATQ